MKYSSEYIGSLTVSLFTSCDTRRVFGNWTLSQFLSLFNEEEMKSRVMEMRSLEYKSDAYKEKKKSIPCATLSCACERVRGREYVIARNPVMCIDIDLDDNPRLSEPGFADSLISALMKWPCVYAAGKSCSGRGVFVVVAIASNNDDEEFVEYFRALEDDFRQSGIFIDKNCKDVTRLRIASCDAVSVKSGEIDAYEKRMKAPPISVKSGKPVKPVVGSEMDLLEEVIEMLIEARFDPSEYSVWLQCAFHLRPLGLTGLTLLDRLSSNSSNYMGFEDVKKKFNEVSNSTCTFDDACKYFFSIAKRVIGLGYRYDAMTRIIKRKRLKIK